MRKTLIVLSPLILVAVGAPARAGYTFTPVTIPGSVDTEVYGINNAGVASGYYYDGTNFHGFLAANGGNSVSFGFVGNQSGANPPPASFTLNGTACTTG